MKKMIAICLLLAAIQTAWAIDAKQVFNEFKEARNAEYVSIPRFLMKLGMMFVDKDEVAEAGQLMNSVHSMKVLDLERCSDSVKQKFMKRINALKDDQYETLMRVSDADDKVKILIREEKESIKEILIVCSGSADCALIQFKGNFKESDIEALVEQAEKQRKE
ncbi:DUF4252 domain-containing protein [Bacteroides sp.]|uniref:DUF4252 domain-containing protein n=1 Tax=Bacteroides sp. TaxID=29523 RepID=UPI0023D4FF34|nr:DUF4252 domain-containing protein [Bacteroides sp.]MDE5711548.1 DUF4252 domain-containing protein [Bacteroides sp.]MDE5759904.1 DUF4252 domain-containing protein [Bacteroides sp.]MDE6216286.1 DUF4252 domain-containing protein [Bacteroides sp.]